MAKMLPLLAVSLATAAFAASNTTVINASTVVAESPMNFLASRAGDVDTVNVSALASGAPSADLKMEMSMEAALTDLMLGKGGKFGATPMGGSVKQIASIITKTMMPKVITAHKSDQRNLEKLADELGKCGSTKKAGLSKAKDPSNTYHENSRLHKKCRNGQAVSYASKNACLDQQRSLYHVKVLRCKYFATVSRNLGTQKANNEIVKKAGGEKTEQYIRRISSTICGKHVHGAHGETSSKGGWGGGLPNSMLDQYLKAKEKCETAQKTYNSKVKECKVKYHAYNVMRATCNQYQTQMDSNSCKAAVMIKDVCESYAECYYDKKKAYNIFLQKTVAEETDRKAEWRGLMRMECLIKAFADGKVSASEVDTCKKKAHSTKHLNIKYPKLPPLQTCSLPRYYPSTGAYKRREYAPLPTVAKGMESAPCSGVTSMPTTPRAGSPKGAKCTRVTLNGYYSPGGLVKCENGLDVRRSRDKSSCPRGTKIFAPATRNDWKTLLASAEPLRNPNWIIDVTRPANGCGGCQANPMNSGNAKQSSWRTSDGSPWWLRSTKYTEPNGDYKANCYMDLWKGKPRNENVISFNDGSCSYHSKSYYCQPINLKLTPKSGSPTSCKCSKVDLTGKYSAGVLVKCEHCITVSKSTQKNSCPTGMKLFSPANRGDWKTFLASAKPLRAPNWIVDITRPSSGCGGCKRYPMKSSQPQQATWRTADGSPWWLRSTVYSEPNGDYTANCYLNIEKNPSSPDTLHFNDGKCKYHSRSYFCQPTRRDANYGGHHRRRRDIPKPKKKKLTLKKACYLEEQFYFSMSKYKRVPTLRGRPVKDEDTNKKSQVWYRNTGGKWSGWRRGDNFAGRWTTTMNVLKGGAYEFRLSSDDGSKLYIDGSYVLDNDGLHGMRTKKTTQTLEAGEHTLQLYFFEKGGHAGLQFDFKGPDTKNKWSKGVSYGGLVCKEALEPPRGVQKDLSIFKLEAAGWKTWSDVPYSHRTKKHDIQPPKGQCIMWGSKRSAGDTRLALAAIGRRDKIEGKEKVKENGVYWYTVKDKSNGFSEDSYIALKPGDTGGKKADLRLSWHLKKGRGGYRSGKTVGLNGNKRWRKVVMYGPCKDVKE